MDTPETTPETPVVNTDEAKSRTRAFLARHQTKLVAGSIAVASVTSFILGRASNAVVEDVDLVVTTPEESDGSES